ncbi:hypothetical protein [Nocardioides psychrotolerans]|uniref:hypothetical protein n=1 Tax=Nocardioides psychrotolerans TaxID=1005945 RepID=UPI003138135A
MRRALLSLAALTGSVILAACGGAAGSDDAGTGPTSAASQPPAPQPASRKPVPKPSPTPRNELADLAEQAATAVPLPQIPPESGPVLGGDISWPQCPVGMGIAQKRTLGLPLPIPEARYVVIGLTNGPGFYANPCLGEQVTWARENDVLVSAYAVASYPEAPELRRFATEGPYDGSDGLGALRNVGYQQARFNIASMQTAGLETPIVWIDVEPVPDFEWSSDPVANAAVVEGLARGYRDAGYDIGVYSTPYLWEGVVGDLALGVPEWRAAGQTSREEALGRCGTDWVIQGGEAVMGQWVEAGRDQNVTCPGISADLGRWFHRY